MKVSISKIRIDGGTQNRVHLNEETVSEYADALTEGAQFPSVTVFFDGSDYWLADGFHRYHANRKIGSISIEADVRDGTRRDAILYSVGVNAAHGLRRTNADKRKAVETLLNDEEWAKWSDNQIAKACQVSHTFVAKLKNVTCNVSSDNKPTYINKHGHEAQMDVSRIGKSQAEPIQKPSPKTSEPTIPEGMVLYSKDEFEENIRLLNDATKDNESMVKVFESDDRLVAATAEIKRLNALITVLEDRNRGMMNECNEAKRLARSWKNRFEKLERECKAAGLVDF